MVSTLHMTPKFADAIAWQQAELLMQPVFIRVIDNLRKQLEESTWKGTYHDTPIWPEGVSEETKTQVLQLQQQLIAATHDQAEAIEQTLAQLPRFQPGYELWLEQQGQQIKLDLWQLCYQVCFRDYHPESPDDLISIDTQLLDEDGEVDWYQLDQKAKHLIEQIFSQLPTEAAGD